MMKLTQAQVAQGALIDEVVSAYHQFRPIVHVARDPSPVLLHVHTHWQGKQHTIQR